MCSFISSYFPTNEFETAQIDQLLIHKIKMREIKHVRTTELREFHHKQGIARTDPNLSLNKKVKVIPKC